MTQGGGDGYQVMTQHLDACAGTLQGKADQAKEIAGIVQGADVGNESWGVVGIFVKQEYTNMLHGLTELLGAMEQGCHSASGKLHDCAEIYRKLEQDHKQQFEQLMQALGGGGAQQ